MKAMKAIRERRMERMEWSSREKTTVVSLSHAEFEALPLKIQSKYFSPLERLRIAESAEQQFLFGPTPLHHQSHRRRVRLHHRQRRILRRAPGPHRCCDFDFDFNCNCECGHYTGVSQQASSLYRALPAKLRRQHLSREEQLLLFGTYSSPSQQRALNTFQFDLRSRSSSEEDRSRRPSRSPSPHANINTTQPFGKEEARERQKHQQQKHQNFPRSDAMAPPVSHAGSPPQAHFRRTLSLSSISLPFRHSTSSAPIVVDQSSPFGHSQTRLHQRSVSQTQLLGRRSSHAAAAPVFDPEATHYRDPEARKKLRMFLASPQKFDEAVEFGFPATAGNIVPQPSYQLPPIATDAQHFSRDFQTFLRDDKMSFLDNEEDSDLGEDEEGPGMVANGRSDSPKRTTENHTPDSDGDSLEDFDSPITPSSIGPSFRVHTRGSPSHFSSLDSTDLSPMHLMNGRINREMTLRMTLTRPDLRADEEQLYGWRTPSVAKDDPYALEELHLTDDMTGANGAFAVKPKAQGNLVTRLFKRASKRGGR
ncbi:hypothetical protein BU24DRAFT_463962 [Aaosphaeria arxii CBS 175.79]|uniref:Uncharacterized protein n=1 Tax=Aaosphaeria arxii CBS 175.79 TaxID=1450172 RepID=A0A6A5XK61_9PLEO|nr:uncharacterized protein BU24DRAFT_463962 [Aaosphaeria arxii CBS 175.79]KAF2013140.1 hypothetical protein BU24DRAFT_463962 [Aaosphaeria arxii CBS 175.79]